MTKEMERLKEIEGRKAELSKELTEGKPDETRMTAIETETNGLKAEEKQIRSKIAMLEDLTQGEPIAESRTGGMREKRAAAVKQFRSSGRMNISARALTEKRTVLVSSGTLATPTAVSTEIGELPTVVSSIIDDVNVKDATGTGSWKIPYRATDAAAASVTEGSAVAGTAGTFGTVTISPAQVGVLDEVSNQVKQMTDVDYAMSVQGAAYLALRRKAKENITAKIIASTIAENLYSKTLDATFIRNIVLGFGSDESVGGGTKLYINKTDLATLGAIRGTNEKKPVYEITFTDENNGMIQDGGMAVPFSINSSLTTGVQLYGQPQSVQMLLWGDYEVATDEGGDYFARNVMAVRGLATSGADLVKYHGMQVIHQAAGT